MFPICWLLVHLTPKISNLKKFYAAFIAIFSLGAAALTLPGEMFFSADGKILYSGGQPAEGLYDKTVIRNVYLDFAQSDYWTQLTNNYASETDIPATMIIDGQTYADVGVRFRGNTSYTTIGG